MWSYDRGAKYFKCFCWNHSDISGRQSRLKKNISGGGIISDQQKIIADFCILNNIFWSYFRENVWRGEGGSSQIQFFVKKRNEEI